MTGTTRPWVPGGVSGIICIINMHLSHIFDEGELDKNVVVIMSLTSLLWKVEHHTEE